MKINAYAKINLALNVVARREDGYHELDMIMAPISLHDTLDVTLAKEDSLSCDNEKLVLDHDNTIVKAMQIMRDRYHIKEHFRIAITKRIPMQAGLAGGSADGAAMLKAINFLCQLHLSLKELAMIGVEIGADVPFCIYNTICRVQGIGEKIQPIKFPISYFVLLIKPSSGVSTPQAFRQLNLDICSHPNIDHIVRLMEVGDESFLPLLKNSLEQSAFLLNRDIEHIKKALLNSKVSNGLMSGSGSSVFALSKDKEQLQMIADQWKDTSAFVGVFELFTKKETI